MAIAPEVERLLNERGIEHEVIHHPRAFTAQEEAAAAHVSGHTWAKTVAFVREDDAPLMAVLPASCAVDIPRLEELAEGALRLATEDELERFYAGCERGAMPPLGNLYRQPVYVDERLARAAWITFEAGSHEEAVRMRYADFERLVGPTLGSFAAPSHTGGRR